MPPKKGKSTLHLNYNPGEAFSGQKKKALLQKKRAKNRKQDDSDSEGGSDEDFEGITEELKAKLELKAEKKQPVLVTSFGGKGDAEGSRLSSLFTREDKEDVAVRRTHGEQPIVEPVDKKAPVAPAYVPFQATSATSEGGPTQCSMGLKLPHPVRPKWDASISTANLAKQEEEYFQQWSDDTFAHIDSLGSASADVAPFELNLEVWRQLWRVIEQSDVVVLIVDVRNPTFHLPPSLVHDVTVTQGRRLVIALSKCDLVPQAFVRRWQRYLTSQLPNVGVVEFMSRPADDPPGGERGAGGIAARRRWLARRTKQADIEDHLNVMAKVMMASALEKEPFSFQPEARQRQKADRKQNTGCKSRAAARREVSLDVECESGAEESTEAVEANTAGDEWAHEKEKDEVTEANTTNVAAGYKFVGRGPGGTLAIGLVGHPNVGKTSVLNAFAGRKAASVSGTAGHTRHLQHIKVDETVHPNAYVIDCPGLVFPSLNPRAQAELNGLLPLAQVRESMTGVRILAEALPLTKQLALKMPDWYEEHEELEVPWTPLAIVEAYAEKHKYFIPRSGGPDVHRAGLEILKDAKDGAMLLAYEPPS